MFFGNFRTNQNPSKNIGRERRRDSSRSSKWWSMTALLASQIERVTPMTTLGSPMVPTSKICFHLGIISAPLRAILGHLVATWSLLRTPLRLSCGHLGPILGLWDPSWNHFGASWSHLEASWCMLLPSRFHFGFILSISDHFRIISHHPYKIKRPNRQS